MSGPELLWMEPAEPLSPPFQVVYRNRFTAKQAGRLRFRYSADERCMIFLDGRRIAEGPELGTPENWHEGSVDCELPPGSHRLTARVSSFGPVSAIARMPVRHGFFFEEQSTFVAGKWECQPAAGITFPPSEVNWGTGPRAELSADFNWSADRGEGGEWKPVALFADTRELHPPELPPMRFEEICGVQRGESGFFLPEYACVWAEYEFEGAGAVEIRWFERTSGGQAGSADKLTLPGGRVRRTDFKFRAGRRVEFEFTGNARLADARFFRTGYPLRLEKPPASADPRRERLLRAAFRTLECCAMETYFDCPFYEQLQYVSDSRIEMLATLAATGDERLPRKMLREFARGLFDCGALRDRFPSRDPEAVFEPGVHYVPMIPSFCALYLQAVHDFQLLRPDAELAEELLPALRRIAAWLRSHRAADGLYRELPGWNFIDWVPGWEYGVPTHCERGCGCTLNWMIVQSLRDLADLERAFGVPDSAPELEREAAETARAIRRVFFDRGRNCFAEDETHRTFSEHAQVFAALVEGSAEPLNALRTGELDNTGISFDFYYFEACARFGEEKLAAARLERYYAFADNGLDTLPETFADWRSCCHAWSAHSLWFERRPRDLGDRLVTASGAGAERSRAGRFQPAPPAAPPWGAPP